MAKSDNPDEKVPGTGKATDPSAPPYYPKSTYDFHPVRIKGEPMSETIIRERREGR
jgi:hypothetical protein